MRTAAKQRLRARAHGADLLLTLAQQDATELHDPQLLEHIGIAQIALIHVNDRLDDLVADDCDEDDDPDDDFVELEAAVG